MHQDKVMKNLKLKKNLTRNISWNQRKNTDGDCFESQRPLSTLFEYI